MENVNIAYISGMSCRSCAITVEKILQSQQGVKRADVNFADHTVSVELDNNHCSKKKIAAAFKNTGYHITWISGEENHQGADVYRQEYGVLKKKTIWAVIFGAPVLMIAMFLPETPAFRWLMMFLSFPVLTLWGNGFFKRAWRSLQHGYWGMDVLVALSTSVAFFYSAFNTFFPGMSRLYSLDSDVYFETSVVIICFLLIGKTLEHRARMKSSEAIQGLLHLQPPFAHLLLKNNQEIQVPINQIAPGAYLRVKSGEKIPVDGCLQKGHSYIDERMITGEPLPVFKTIGDKVFAGTINQGGSFDFVAEKTGAHTFLSNVIQLVRKAQSSKASIEKIADKIAKVFVPSVVLIALIAFFYWGFSALENSWFIGARSFLSVLIISCPCALGLAVPTALIAGISRAAQEGILIKDAQSLECARRIDHLILDKTGTLTQGKPVVKEAFWLKRDDYTISVFLEIEGKSEHPLAAALLLHYKNHLNKIPLSVEHFNNHSGRGVEAIYEKKNYRIGSISWLEQQGVVFNLEFQTLLSDWKKQAYTLLGFSEDDRLLAIFALSDTLRDEAKAAVQKLQRMGIELHVLTGDRLETAKVLSDSLGISDVQGAQMPSDKMNFVKKLQEKRKSVAMVGDGINDAPALAQADLSIAMSEGSGIAIEAAKVTVLGSDLRKIPFALYLSKRTWFTIRQNLFWAFIYNVVSIPLAAGVGYPFTGFFLNPMMASMAMALSSISVIANSLRLKNLRHST